MDDQHTPRRRAARLVVIGFCLVLGGVWLIPGAAADENRALADFPAFSAADGASAAYFRGVDAALIDHLPVRGRVITAVGAGLVDAGFSTSRDVFISPSGEPYYTGDFTFSCLLRPQISLTDSRIRDLRGLFAAHHIDLLWAIPPDKTSAERERLGPLGSRLMRCADANRADLQAMADTPGSPLLVGWNEFSAAPGSHYLYGDSHWTSEGAALFAGLIIERLSRDGVARPGLWDAEAVTDVGSRDIEPDLFRLMGVTRSEPVSHLISKRDGIDIDFDTEDHDGLSTIRWQTTGPDVIPGRTLILHDSFFDLHEDVLAPYFADLTSVPLSTLATPGALAMLDGYDHVIVEQVQRFTPLHISEIADASWITAGR